jgi:hydroxyacylglutathione hydrolase
MPNRLQPFSVFITFFASLLSAQAPQPDGAGVETGVVPASWPASGPKCMETPDWLVHEYNPNLYLIRQSGCLDFEKPFLFLIFGKDRGLLLDTGSRNFPAAEMLQNVAGKWLKRNQRASIEIVVVHTHPHSDHVAGDEELKHLNSPSISIKLVPPTLEDSKAFYGISNWPDQTGSVDLGDRVIDAIPIPGHSPVSIAFYDRRTAILFTGDSLYPGRLYVNNWDDFVKSTRRLVDFTKGKLVAHVLGNHIEQSRTAYLDYPVGTIYQPNEHSLAMSRGDLLELMDALSSLHEPTRLAMRDFSIWPVPPDSQPHGKALEKFKAREKQQLEQMWNQPPQN